MPRVKVIADDGWIAWDERVSAADFDTDHFRSQLAERLWWAAEESERREDGAPREQHDERGVIREGRWAAGDSPSERQKFASV